jgi:hypothetical protein
MKTEERIEKLERELAELKKELKPEFEVGWYKNTARDNKDILIYWNEHKKSLYGFDINGDWFDDEEYGFHEYYDIPATDKEVKEALIEEAKRRGFKEGVTVNEVGDRCNGNMTIIGNEYDLFSRNKKLMVGDGIVFNNGKWADIIENKVFINGIEMKQDGDVVSFGCAMFEIKQLRELLDAVNCWNSWVIDGDMNRKIKSITLDSDVTITVEQLKSVCDNLK